MNATGNNLRSDSQAELNGKPPGDAFISSIGLGAG